MDPVLPLYFPFLLNPLQALAQENESKTAVVFKKIKKKKKVCVKFKSLIFLIGYQPQITSKHFAPIEVNGEKSSVESVTKSIPISVNLQQKCCRYLNPLQICPV